MSGARSGKTTGTAGVAVGVAVSSLAICNGGSGVAVGTITTGGANVGTAVMITTPHGSAVGVPFTSAKAVAITLFAIAVA